MYNQDEKLKEIVNSDRLDSTLSMNILINAAKSNWNNFNDVDRFLISKALQTIQHHAQNKEDFIVKFRKD